MKFNFNSHRWLLPTISDSTAPEPHSTIPPTVAPGIWAFVTLWFPVILQWRPALFFYSLRLSHHLPNHYLGFRTWFVPIFPESLFLSRKLSHVASQEASAYPHDSAGHLLWSLPVYLPEVPGDQELLESRKCVPFITMFLAHVWHLQTFEN